MAVFVANLVKLFGRGWPEMFLGQLKFHYMAAGALAAWLLLERREALMASRVFSSRPLQWAIWLFLLQYVFLGALPGSAVLDELAQAFLFPWLIVETAVNPRRLVRLDLALTEWLGQISYGFYMFHMIAVYATSFVFLGTGSWSARPVLYVAAYYAMAIALTTLLSYLSFRFLEAPILRQKYRFAR
jgi:peptidoglycan/LPS O-acetylase OafA/YrhL